MTSALKIAGQPPCPSHTLMLRRLAPKAPTRTLRVDVSGGCHSPRQPCQRCTLPPLRPTLAARHAHSDVCRGRKRPMQGAWYLKFVEGDGHYGATIGTYYSSVICDHAYASHP